MRVMVDCHMVAQPRAGDAGNGRYAVNLVSALAATAAPGDEVHAAISHPLGARALAVPTLDIPADGPRRLLRAGPRALARIGADVGVFTYVGPPRAPCPLALIVHDASFVHDPQWLGRRTAGVLNALVPRSARRAAVVFAVSATGAADVAAALGLDPSRIAVVPNYPAAVFHPRDGARERVMERFGVHDYVLAVGDVSPRKNLGALAEAVGRLDPRPPLVLVGRPGRDGHRIVAGTGARWLGHVSDAELADLYRAAAVTACPSRYEGFGLTAAEALACASPVVASAGGAHPEVVGDAALLAAPEPAALADALRAALEPATAHRLRAAGPLRAATFNALDTGAAGWRALRTAAGR